MKKAALLAAVGILSFGLSGCGQPAQEEAAPEEVTATEEAAPAETTATDEAATDEAATDEAAVVGENASDGPR